MSPLSSCNSCPTAGEQGWDQNKSCSVQYLFHTVPLSVDYIAINCSDYLAAVWLGICLVHWTSWTSFCFKVHSVTCRQLLQPMELKPYFRSEPEWYLQQQPEQLLNSDIQIVSVSIYWEQRREHCLQGEFLQRVFIFTCSSKEKKAGWISGPS